MDLTWVAVTAAFLVASFVKGTTGMGFPLIATPMVALLVDIKVAYALLVLPNIVMDALQIARGAWPWHLWRRLAWMLGTTVLGVFLGTRILLSVPERVIYLALAATILLFLGVISLRVRLVALSRWEAWLGPTVGLANGILAGITNVPGPLPALYLLGLDFEKRDFVKGLASIVLTAKLSQMAAISRWGLYTWEIVGWSAGLAGAALVGFGAGLRVHDRVPQATFGRVVHLLLFGMGVVFIYRGLR
jgi:hypothetical protein